MCLVNDWLNGIEQESTSFNFVLLSLSLCGRRVKLILIITLFINLIKDIKCVTVLTQKMCPNPVHDFFTNNFNILSNQD